MPSTTSTRRAARNRRALSTQSRPRSSTTQRLVRTADLHKSVPALLVELLRDPRVSVLQFRRMAMAAGAVPSDFFDAATGKPYNTKQDILLEMVRGNRAVTYIPKFITRVSDWLTRASVVPAAIVGAVSGGVAGVAAGAAGEAAKQHLATAAATVTAPVSVLPDPSGVIANTVGVMPQVVAVLAAVYIVFRGLVVYRRNHSYNTLTKLLTQHLPATDTPFQRVRDLSTRVDKRTYAQTSSVLKRSYDNRLHELFREHHTLPAIRQALLALRKPWFFGGRTLLTLHLLRNNGQVRDSPAEIAYALHHTYTSREVFDAAVSYSASTVRTLFAGMGRVVGVGVGARSRKRHGGGRGRGRGRTSKRHV